MWYSGFWLSGKVWNNAISYDKRSQITKNPKIFVANLVNWEIEDVKLGDKIVFEELDKNWNIERFSWLKNFVELDLNGKKIFVIDNHNHALFLRAMECFKHNIKWIPVVHVDQHSDMNEPENIENFEKNMDLKEIFDYTNLVCNVGNFIIPAQKLWIVGKIYQLRTENSLLNFKISEKNFILDIDLDFWADEMGILKFEKTINAVKKILAEAKFVTIATSPYFIKQELALHVLEKILSS